MAEKITPPTKSAGKSDGLKNGGDSTLTTPKDNEGKVWSSGQGENDKIF